MIDLVKQVADELEKRREERLSDGVYWLRHELIGKPCLYSDGERTYPAIPYRAYKLNEDDEIHVSEHKRGKPLLTILYYAENEIVEGINVKVKVMSAIGQDDLIPIDPSSIKGQEIYHTILSWLASNRHGTFGKVKETASVTA